MIETIETIKSRVTRGNNTPQLKIIQSIQAVGIVGSIDQHNSDRFNVQHQVSRFFIFF